MYELKGHHRDSLGLIKRGTILVERAGDQFRDAYPGSPLIFSAMCDAYGEVEIIDQYTNTDSVYEAFLPDVGECERIGMPIRQLQE